MLSVNRDALLCDLAETYGIYDFRALPVETLAALSFGLRPDSRIKMELIGIKPASDMQMLASIADSLSLIRHALLDDDDTKKPPLFQEEMYRDVKRPKVKIYRWSSSEEFKEYWSSV